MTSIVVVFDLKAGVDPARYEAWARQTDMPNVKALASVRDFRVLRVAAGDAEVGDDGSRFKPCNAFADLFEQLLVLEPLHYRHQFNRRARVIHLK